VVRNDDPVEAVALQDGQDADHIDVAFIDEGPRVMGHRASDVAKIKVGDLALPAVKILDGCQSEAGILDRAPDLHQLRAGPKPFQIGGDTPRLISRLPREIVVFARQHVPVESQADCHRFPPRAAPLT